MNYSPKNMQVWDAWYMQKGNELHMYHLQRWRKPIPAGMDPKLEDWLGHSVTTNLLDWEERPAAFSPNYKSTDDDLQPWSGCAIWHNNRAHMFYTMRGSAHNGRVQGVGLAMGATPDHFTHYEGNPIVLPDPRWGASIGKPVPGYRDCRDLMVVPDPKGGGFYGYYATREMGEELPMTAAFGCVYSKDLIHWEHRGIAFAPRKYACVEFPDVFFLNGKWYLTCLAGNYYGNRGCFTDPNLMNGTIYAVAEKPEGPFVELADNALAAARTTFVLSIRSFDFEGQRHVLYTDREREGFTDGGAISFGTISTPKVLRTTGDRLWIGYSPIVEKRVSKELIGVNVPPVLHEEEGFWGQHWPMPTVQWKWGEVISGQAKSGWGVAPLGCKAESFILEADIKLGAGTVAGGFAIRGADLKIFGVVGVDASTQEVFYADGPDFDFMEQRRTAISTDKWMHLKVVNRREHLEVYLDEELRLAFSRYRGIGGKVGLWMDRGQVEFRNVRMRELKGA